MLPIPRPPFLRDHSQDGRGSVRFDSDQIRFRFAPVPVHTQFRFKTVPVHTDSRVVDLKMVFFGCPCSCLRRVVDLKKVFFGCPKSTQNTGSGSRPVPVHTSSGSQKFRFTRFRLIEKRFGSRPPCSLPRCGSLRISSLFFLVGAMASKILY